MIDLNVGALTDLCRAVAPAMIERKSGAILNVASTAAFQPGPNMAVYFATKAFVLSLSEALARGVEAARREGHRFCPGPTRTEFGVAGFGGNGLFDRVAMDSPRGGSRQAGGLAANRAIVVSGLVNKIGAQARALLHDPWFGRSPGQLNIEQIENAAFAL